VRLIKEYNDYLDAHPALKTYVDQMDFAQVPNPIDYDALKISRHLAEAIERATVGNADPRAVLEESAARSNALLKASSGKATR